MSSNSVPRNGKNEANLAYCSTVLDITHFVGCMSAVKNLRHDFTCPIQRTPAVSRNRVTFRGCFYFGKGKEGRVRERKRTIVNLVLPSATYNFCLFYVHSLWVCALFFFLLNTKTCECRQYSLNINSNS